MIPAPLRDFFKDVKEPAELYDYSGNPLGRFTPATPGDKKIDCEPPPMSEEELQRIENEEDGMTTEELLASLENFPCSP